MVHPETHSEKACSPIDTEICGYKSFRYAESFSSLGKPLKLAHAGGWLVRRPVAHSEFLDAMGCYPLFSCERWGQLELDLSELGDQIVSATIVTDPFGQFTPDLLKKCFPDLAIPYKDHFVLNLELPLFNQLPEQHRRNARRSLKDTTIEICHEPMRLLEDWICLYGNLVQRHSIRGLPAFSRTAFESQFQTPGLTVLRALKDNETVSMLLWYTHGDVAYYHLGAHSDLGYELRASFALFWRSIEYFAEKKLKWLDFGASAGANNRGEEDGLARFKRGWSSELKPVWLCGRICNPVAYAELVRSRQLENVRYFPAYRWGEFD